MSRVRILASTLALTSILAPVAGGAGLPSAVPDLPVLGVETPTGSIARSAAAPVAPTPKVIDGAVDDWSGEITRLGGTSILSHGELVYQDYLGDAWGADDGFDAGRKQTLDGLKATEPRTYRIDPFQQAAGAQFDAPRPIGAELHYGDTTAVDATRMQADIEEVRVAADAQHLLVLVRTMAMTDPAATGVLLLLDTAPGGSYVLDRSGGGVTTAAEWAFVVHASGVKRVYHSGVAVLIGCQDPCLPAPFQVAANPSGYINAMEIAIRRDFFDGLGPLPDAFGIGVATGVADPVNSGFAAVLAGDARSDLMNVAFRR